MKIWWSRMGFESCSIMDRVVDPILLGGAVFVAFALGETAQAFWNQNPFLKVCCITNLIPNLSGLFLAWLS